MANSEVMRLKYRRENSYEDEKEKNRDLTNKILDYLDEGLNENEISKILGVSKRKMSRLIKDKKNLVNPKQSSKKNMSKEEFIAWAYKIGIISSK